MTAAFRRPVQRGPIFVLKIQGRPGTAGLRGLRMLLKTLLRRYGFRALDLREIDAGGRR
jgi:hypothetical protein